MPQINLEFIEAFFCQKKDKVYLERIKTTYLCVGFKFFTDEQKREGKR